MFNGGRRMNENSLLIGLLIVGAGIITGITFSLPRVGCTIVIVGMPCWYVCVKGGII